MIGAAGGVFVVGAILFSDLTLRAYGSMAILAWLLCAATLARRQDKNVVRAAKENVARPNDLLASAIVHVTSWIAFAAMAGFILWESVIDPWPAGLYRY
jgi:hypothetical protein